MFALSQSSERAVTPDSMRFARQDPSPKVRGEAIFWLSQRAGQRAAAQITAAIEKDPDTDVKKRAVFALSQLPKDEGVPLLIQVAKTNTNPAVRKQAISGSGNRAIPARSTSSHRCWGNRNCRAKGFGIGYGLGDCAVGLEASPQA